MLNEISAYHILPLLFRKERHHEKIILDWPCSFCSHSDLACCAAPIRLPCPCATVTDSVDSAGLASYGISIILFTIVIYSLFFPLKWRSSRSMKKAQKLADGNLRNIFRDYSIKYKKVPTYLEPESSGAPETGA
jgi:hypothetical protein